MEHSGQTEKVVSMQMADENTHLPVRSAPCLKKLLLCSLAAIEKEKFWSPAH
jgi:hypothetical protein